MFIIIKNFVSLFLMIESDDVKNCSGGEKKAGNRHINSSQLHSRDEVINSAFITFQ